MFFTTEFFSKDSSVDLSRPEKFFGCIFLYGYELSSFFPLNPHQRFLFSYERDTLGMMMIMMHPSMWSNFVRCY